MNATVVYCWEYGAGLGHISNLAQVARQLQPLTKRAILVNPSIIPTTDNDLFDEEFELPHGLQLVDPAVFQPQPIVSYNSVIQAFGYGSVKILFTRLRLWEQLFDRLKPDLIVADFAPAALMAARGRIPTVAIGNGYTLPAVNIDHYPRMNTQKDPIDDRALFRSVNKALLMAGLCPIKALPEIFKADIHACFTLPEIDLFGEIRSPPVLGPILPNPIKQTAFEGKTKLFAYLTHCRPEIHQNMVEALVQLDLPIDLYSLQTAALNRELVASTKLRILNDPITLERITNEYSHVVHLGSHSLTTELLMAGVPQIIFSIDMEKLAVGQTLSRVGISGHLQMELPRSIETIVATIKSTINDTLMAGKVLAFAHSWTPEQQMSGLITLEHQVRELLEI